MAARRFILVREEDETGVSGTGIVVEGVQFSDGHVAYRWMSDYPTNQSAESMEIVERIHGHNGKTQVLWLDSESGSPIHYLDRIIKFLDTYGGEFGVSCNPKAEPQDRWSVSLAFSEAEDNPAYSGMLGSGETGLAVIEKVLREAGVTRERI